MTADLTSVGRHELVARIAQLEAENGELRAECARWVHRMQLLEARARAAVDVLEHGEVEEP